MPFITTSDGTEIFYKDWGPKDAQPIVFHHGWPLSADDWDNQLMFFLGQGYRVSRMTAAATAVPPRPTPATTWTPTSSDVKALVRELDLRNAIHVGHSTGGGEVTRYVARAEPGRVSKAVIISAIPPLMLKTEANPGGTPIEAFEAYRAASLPTARKSTSISHRGRSTASTAPASCRWTA